MSGQSAVTTNLFITTVQRVNDYKVMKLQSERDRVDRRIVETKLSKMTKDRDSFKVKFADASQQVNDLEERLADVRFEYDELLTKFNYTTTQKEQAQMHSEDMRSIIVTYEDKFKELKKWEQVLLKKEKEVRSIKKRENPYEYVDFSDQYVQTSNPTKERGINTDEHIIGFISKSTKETKSNLRSSFADSVTTVLGGLPAATESIMDIDIATPSDMKYYSTQQSYKPQQKANLNLKTRPQS